MFCFKKSAAFRRDHYYGFQLPPPNEKVVSGLIFNRLKFSEGDSTTVVQASHIISGLDNLLKERGLLFDVSSSTAVDNQIARLDVKEEHIVYCWSVLRKTASFNTLRNAIRKHAHAVGFRGSVVVAVSEKISDSACQQCGDTFKDLALISSSRPFR